MTLAQARKHYEYTLARFDEADREDRGWRRVAMERAKEELEKAEASAINNVAHGYWFNWKQRAGGYPKARSAYIAGFETGAAFASKSGNDSILKLQFLACVMLEALNKLLLHGANLANPKRKARVDDIRHWSQAAAEARQAISLAEQSLSERANEP